MVCVRYQGTDLISFRRPIRNCVARKWTRASIQYPRTITGHPSLIRRYGVEKEMNMHAGQLLGVPKGLIVDYIGIPRAQGDGIDANI